MQLGRKLLPGGGVLARVALAVGLWLWAAVSSAQVSWVGYSSSMPTTLQSSVTLTRPTGVAFADLLVAQIAVNPSSATVTAPTGWTQVDAVVSGSVKQYIFYRPAQDPTTGSEPGSYTFSISPSSRVAAAVFAIRGAEMIPPIFQSYSVNTATGSTLSTNEVTATNSGSYLVALFAQGSGSAAITPQSTLTSRYSGSTGSASGASGVAIGVGSETLTSVGPTGSRTALSTSGVGYVASMFALRKATQSCFSDGFGSTLSTSDWAATVRNGTFTPQTVSGRLRMTQNVGNQSTAVTLQRMIPAAGNQVVLQYKHYAYGYVSCAADGVVAVLSDATVTPQPGGYGGSLGYAQYSVGPTPGFSGGWLGIGLDEYGNFSNNSENRTLSPSGWTVPSGVAATSGGNLRQDSVIVRGSTPNYYYLAGTSSLSPGVDANTTSTGTPLPGYVYRITVDSRVPGQAWVKVERDTTGTGTSYTTLLNSFDALATNSAQQDSTGAKRTPDNFFLSFTAGTGGCNNIHEIDDLQVCALKLDNFSALIDHFQFYWDGAANTCQAEPVRVMACTDAACSSLYTGTVTMTLATSNASSQWQDSNGNALTNNQVTFSGGSVNLRLSQSSAVTETLNVASSTPVARPLSVSGCFSSTSGAQYANCNVAFAGTANFTFGASGSNVIGPLEAGVESGPVRIQANNSSCSGAPSAFKNKTQNVRFWFNYLDPTASAISSYVSAAPPRVWVDPYEAATNTTQMFWELPTTQASGIQKTVYFDNNGVGYFNLIYPDVGQLQISADVTAQSISGTGTFVVKPYQFAVTGVQRTADGVANAAASGPAGGVFIRAGDSFTATVTAQNAAHKITAGSGSVSATPLSGGLVPYGRTTKMFGKEQTPEGVRVASDGAVMQPAGGVNPAIGNGDVPGSSFGTGSALGSATITNFNWPEVGIIGLQPRILPASSESSGDYLGAGDVTRYVSPNIGRFIPASFAMTGAALNNRNDLTCAPAAAFTYLDEPIGVGFTLLAQARSGSVTANYAGSFAKLSLPGGAVGSNNLAFAVAQPVVATPATAFTALSGRLSTTGFAGSWPAVGTSGAGQVALSGTVMVSSLNSPSNNRVGPDGPFPSARIGIAPDSNEGSDATGTAMHVLMANYDLDSDNSGGSTGPDHTSLGTVSLRFGQMQLIPGIGSERLPATIPAQILYWNGVAFIPNGIDNCTSVPAGQLSLAKHLTGGDTAVTSGNLIFSAGKGNIRLASPGAGSSGTVDVTANLSAAGLGYLLTRRGGATKYDQNPSATAAFGLYKGANQIIHMREMY